MWGVLLHDMMVHLWSTDVLLVNNTGPKELCLDHEAWGFSSAFFGCKEKQIARFSLVTQKRNGN
jgi:hypothetical protein